MSLVHSRKSTNVQESEHDDTRPRYSGEEFGRRGQEIYDRDIRPILRDEDDGKFVAIDIESGQYEIDIDDRVALDRLWARLPDPQPLVIRVGYRAAHWIGCRADSVREPKP